MPCSTKHLHHCRLLPAAAVLLTTITFTTHVKASPSADKQHLAAIAQARQGHYDTALEKLEALTETYPSRRVFLHDYITVLTWAGRDAEALEQLPQLRLERTPVYLLNLLGKAARNRQQPKLAARIYRTALKLGTKRYQSRLGLALSLAEAGRPAEAERHLDLLLQRRPRSIELLEALAYIRERDRNYAAAIAAYDRILSIDPDRRSARKGRILNLMRAGATHEAARLAQRDPELFTTEEAARIAGHQAAAVVRWGRLPVRDPAIRYRQTDRAIALLQLQYEKLRARDPGVTLRNRFDLISAYRDRRRMEEAVTLYEQLRKEGVQPFPPYVLAAAGEARLALRQPERAVALLERAVDGDPHNLDARYALYYAYLESGQPERAVEYIDHLAASLPPRNWLPGSREPQWSSDWLYARSVSAQARAAMGRMDMAEQRLRALANEAPADSDIRNALGGALLWRGWPRQAMEQYRMVLALDPKNPGARIGTATALAARGDLDGSNALLDSLPPYHKDEPQARELRRELQVRGMRELWMRADGGASSSRYLGSSEHTLESYFYDRPWRGGIRPFLSLSRSEADFFGRTALRTRLAAGLHHHGRDRILRASISGGRGSPGVSLQGEWRPTDHWRGRLALESYSNQTPLQAELAGIEAWSFTAGTEYRFHESRTLGISLQRMGFDDGNRRGILTAFGHQRLISGPRYRLEGRLVLHHQSNSLDGAPYFNPGTLQDIRVQLENRWQNWRRYEKAMHQRLLVEAGGTRQDGFGSGLAWRIGYEHHWSFSRRLRLSYGISRSRSFYDGKPEHATRGFITLYARF